MVFSHWVIYHTGNWRLCSGYTNDFQTIGFKTSSPFVSVHTLTCIFCRHHFLHITALKKQEELKQQKADVAGCSQMLVYRKTTGQGMRISVGYQNLCWNLTGSCGFLCIEMGQSGRLVIKQLLNQTKEFI